MRGDKHQNTVLNGGGFNNCTLMVGWMVRGREVFNTLVA